MIIQLQDVELGYGREVVLTGVNLLVQTGDFLAVVGPNGSGKTTLLRSILGTLTPLAGSCQVNARLGYSPQRGTLDPIYPFTAGEVVAMGLLGLPKYPGRHERTRRVVEALEACGMAAAREVAFRDLSGGQKQRVLVARALVAEPDVLVLDEPTNDLDLRGETDVMQLLVELNGAGRTIVMVTHLLHLVARYAERLALIDSGHLQVGPAEELLTGERLHAMYGVPVEVGELAGRRAIVAHPVAPPAEDEDEPT